MKKLVTGILAHVDAGKTTLSEALLYSGGSIRKLGRVDKGDAFLDTYELEKKRGITIFSKQAVLQWRDMWITLLDTPGHVDFSAEMERTLQVLDYAVLVISGIDGVQGHTQTLWRLLSRYNIPTFLFINRMDLAKGQRNNLLSELKFRLDENCIDFSKEKNQEFYEAVAMGDEEALNEFLDSGQVETEKIREMISERKIFPCYFGSALKLDGVDTFMEGMEEYMMTPTYPEEFGARVFKVGRDHQGNRLTYMKITGGSLKVREVIGEDKVNQIRLYSGEKYEGIKEADAGTVCAVTGLTKTRPGEGLGIEADTVLPVLEPVLAYRLLLPEDVDAAQILPKLYQLEEEEPELHITWEENRKEIHVQIMGEIQMEILKSLIAERFGAEVEFGDRSIVYKETIENTVEGVGHFEPLRHYAEVHLLMEPGEEGSGLQFETACSEDLLERNWQRLILTHLEEREHRGVLTGSPITDIKFTLVSGRAHKKHTEGGDFRQAVYRAVRQGLMQAESVLLEPYYDFRLEVPDKMIGRAMADMERMNGTFEPPMIEGDQAVLTGCAPVACLDGYQKEVTSYTGGTGRLTCVLRGYGRCHNEEEVIEAMGYDPDSDTENPSSSVFCSHGAGFIVTWDEVYNYMHLENTLTEAASLEDQSGIEGGYSSRKGHAGRGLPGGKGESGQEETWLGTDEVDAILERTFYANRRGKSSVPKNRWRTRERVVSSPVVRTYKKPEPKEEYLLVDGYNVIYAWDELRELAELNIDSARSKLLDILCNYQGIKKCKLITVFDAYRVQGHATEFLDYHNIHVVYTKEAETADQYIEKFAHEHGRKYDVTVATSDYLEQIIIRGQGCRLMSARELEEEVKRANRELQQEYGGTTPGGKNYLLDSASEEVKRQLGEIKDE